VLDAGLLYLPVGAVWLVAARAGVPLLGFDGVIVPLTAAHFHFAGFGASFVAAMAGRALRHAGVRSRTWLVGAGIVAATPPLVALGIAASREIEVVSACVLAAGMLAMGAALASSVRRSLSGLVPRVLITIAALALVGTMGLACTYAVGTAIGRPVVDIPTMVVTHGAGNAVGFALLAVLAFAMERRPSAAGVESIRFSRLRGGLRIGPAWFARHGLCVAGARAGLLESLDELGRPGHDTRAVAAPIRAFYERAGQMTLTVTPRWRAPFRVPGRIFVAGARAMGQLVLPVEPREHRVASKISPMDEARDGRAGVRISVRTYDGAPPGRDAMYAAAYSIDRDGAIPLMHVALPVPGGHLATLLRLDVTERGIRLTSRGDGREGIWLVALGLRVRVPLHETLDAWADGDAKRAEHRFEVFGIRCVALDYVCRDAQKSG
jgi:hypothetical protein